jgi:hypothetical protein
MIAVACAAGASVADPARSLMLRACCIKNAPPRGYCARGAEKIMIEASAEVSKGGLTNETAPADKSCIVGSGSHVRVRSILAFAVARGGCAEGHDQGPARRKLDNRFDYDARRYEELFARAANADDYRNGRPALRVKSKGQIGVRAKWPLCINGDEFRWLEIRIQRSQLAGGI